jgi:hypothetical protein
MALIDIGHRVDRVYSVSIDIENIIGIIVAMKTGRMNIFTVI